MCVYVRVLVNSSFLSFIRWCRTCSISDRPAGAAFTPPGGVVGRASYNICDDDDIPEERGTALGVGGHTSPSYCEERSGVSHRDWPRTYISFLSANVRTVFDSPASPLVYKVSDELGVACRYCQVALTQLNRIEDIYALRKM